MLVSEKAPGQRRAETAYPGASNGLERSHGSAVPPAQLRPAGRGYARCPSGSETARSGATTSDPWAVRRDERHQTSLPAAKHSLGPSKEPVSRCLRRATCASIRSRLRAGAQRRALSLSRWCAPSAPRVAVTLPRRFKCDASGNFAPFTRERRGLRYLRSLHPGFEVFVSEAARVSKIRPRIATPPLQPFDSGVARAGAFSIAPVHAPQPANRAPACTRSRRSRGSAAAIVLCTHIIKRALSNAGALRDLAPLRRAQRRREPAQLWEIARRSTGPASQSQGVVPSRKA